jgi:hypothetical protein
MVDDDHIAPRSTAPTGPTTSLLFSGRRSRTRTAVLARATDRALVRRSRPGSDPKNKKPVVAPVGSVERRVCGPVGSGAALQGAVDSRTRLPCAFCGSHARLSISAGTVHRLGRASTTLAVSRNKLDFNGAHERARHCAALAARRSRSRGFCTALGQRSSAKPPQTPRRAKDPGGSRRARHPGSPPPR